MRLAHNWRTVGSLSPQRKSHRCSTTSPIERVFDAYEGGTAHSDAAVVRVYLRRSSKTFSLSADGCGD